MTKNLYFTQGTFGEQNLIKDLIEEQIKIYGMEVYYIPRQLFEDRVWHDIYYSQFKESYLIEMYLENFEGFGGKGDLMSKFGLKVTDEITLTVSRRRWKDFVDVRTNKIVTGRPNDGDLIWFPLNKMVYEIKFVENQAPFYQLNGLYVYTLTCELFEYGDSILDTGIKTIDNLNKESGVYPIEVFAPASLASGRAVVSGGSVRGVIVDYGGDGYLNSPIVLFSEPTALFTTTKPNLFKYSQVFDNTNYWQHSASTSVSGTTEISDPNNNYQAYKVNWIGGDGYIFQYAGNCGLQFGKTYTMSIYAKSQSGSPTIQPYVQWNFQPGGTVFKTESVLNTIWQRYTFTFTVNTENIESQGTVGFKIKDDYAYIWGAQLVEAPTAGNYVPSTNVLGISTVQVYGGITASGVGILGTGTHKYSISGVTVVTAGSGYVSTPIVTFGTPDVEANGEFKLGENIVGLTSGVQAKVASWDINTKILEIAYSTGKFAFGEVIQGVESGAKWTVKHYETISLSDAYSENKLFEDQGDTILDFSEGNPFGEYGNLGDMF
jgi:hypothetical protein